MTKTICGLLVRSSDCCHVMVTNTFDMIYIFILFDLVIFNTIFIHLTGLGLLEEAGEELPSRLKHVELKYVTDEDCQEDYAKIFTGELITDNMICVTDPDQGFCQGDSGGKLGGFLQFVIYNHMGRNSREVVCSDLFAHFKNILLTGLLRLS